MKFVVWTVNLFRLDITRIYEKLGFQEEIALTAVKPNLFDYDDKLLTAK